MSASMDDSQSSPMPKPLTPRHRRRLSPPLLLLYGTLALVAVLLVLFGVYEFGYQDRVILGVSVMGQPMNGMTRAEARKFLQDKFGEPDAILKRSGSDPIVLRDGDRTWRAWPWELGLRTDFSPV